MNRVDPVVRTTSANVHAPAANTAATLTLSATANTRIVVTCVGVSYTAAPTGGNLTVESPVGTTVMDLDITAAGPFVFTPNFVAAENTAVKLTVAAGGVGISGTVSVFSHKVSG